MSGRKVFTAGEVLQAADVNDYLMDQSVMVFAGTAARGSAIPSPSEGMVTYLSDSDEVQVYDGSVYKNVGGLVAVKSALFTGTFSASVAGGGNVAVTDLSITHAVANASNRLIISAFFGAAAHGLGQAQTGIGIHDGTSLIGVGATGGSRTSVAAGGEIDSSGSNTITAMPAITFVHTPGAGSKTYTARAINIRTSTYTVYVNRMEDDSDVGNRVRAASALVIQEVSV